MAKDKKKKPAKTKSEAPLDNFPKEVRKQVDKFVELAKHPMVSDIVAAGLVALAASVRKGSSKSDVAPQPADAAGNLTKSATILATALAAKAAETVSSRLFDAAPAAPGAPAAEPTPAPKAAPKTAGRPRKPKAGAEAPAAKAPAKTRATTRKPATTPATTRKPRTPKPPTTT